MAARRCGGHEATAARRGNQLAVARSAVGAPSPQAGTVGTKVSASRMTGHGLAQRNAPAERGRRSRGAFVAARQCGGHPQRSGFVRVPR
ncbi:hypothetical protein ACFWJ5_38430, partial [Streptomyces qaidamensis]|uniref:hypothetical protein n=1 Tax=Streptomyces qaidamensis TaxID=1783515 RepID=UPI0036497B95